jgi:hypothetical protein
VVEEEAAAPEPENVGPLRDLDYVSSVWVTLTADSRVLLCMAQRLPYLQLFGRKMLADCESLPYLHK